MSLTMLGVVTLLSVVVGLASSSWLVVVFMMELMLFTFLFMCYEYKLLGQITACVKYFIIQTLSSVYLFLGGVSMFLYLDYHIVTDVLLTIGLVLKLGGFPLHFWVLPVNFGLSYTMIGVIGSPMKVLPVGVLISYYNSYLGEYSSYTYVVLMFGVLSMVAGMCLGLLTASLRTMLGASSITHTGWLLVALPCSGTFEYFFLYSVGLFVVLLSLVCLAPVFCSFSMLCLGGLPPFSVFTAKLLVVSRWVEASMPVSFLVIVLVTSALSLFYYLKFSLVLYMFPNIVWRVSWLGCLCVAGQLLVSCILFFYFLWPSSQ